MSEPRRNPRRASTSASNKKRYTVDDSSEVEVSIIEPKIKRVKKVKQQDEGKTEPVNKLRAKPVNKRSKPKEVVVVTEGDDAEVMIIDPPKKEASRSKKSAAPSEVKKLRVKRATVPTPPKAPKASKIPKEKRYEMPDLVDANGVPLGCPVMVLERAERVVKQRMFMVDRTRNGDDLEEFFSVLGTTGNIYTVRVGSTSKCSCMDCAIRRNICKHMLFVCLKVLQMDMKQRLWFQKTFSQAQLAQIFDEAPPNPTDQTAIAPAEIRTAYQKIINPNGSIEEVQVVIAAAVEPKIPELGDDCAVCYDEMEADGQGKNSLTYDLGVGGCGKAMHTQCFNMWKATAINKGQQLTCIYCRSPWTSPSAPGVAVLGRVASVPKKKTKGYVNLAQVAGIGNEPLPGF